MSRSHTGFACTALFVAGALHTIAVAEPRISFEGPQSEATTNAPMHVAGRVGRSSAGGAFAYAYQWPGLYFESRFEGRSVSFRVGPGDVILQALVDGKPAGTLVKPAPGFYRIEGLDAGSHAVRINAVTESQAGPNQFGGFTLPASAKPLPLPQRKRQIEFIGDSHTVGYGNTSATRECTPADVWATTDNASAFAPKVAGHYDADYQVNAISGRGIVRNYDGSPGDTLPVSYPFTLFDHSARYADAAWQPQIIVIALGTNDFSTPLHAGEAWSTREKLHADYEDSYVRFVEALRAGNPHAFFVLWATDLAEGEIQAEVRKVFTRLQSKGETQIAFIPIDGLTMTGCHWHPSVADHDAIAEALIRRIDSQLPAWAAK